MKKVVITGATGAIGTAFIKKLISENISVLVLCREGGRIENIPKAPFVKVEYCALDEMSSYEPLEKDYDVFYHLAWAGTYGNSRNDSELQNRNVQYTTDAVRLAKKLGCSAFVGVGSQAENGFLEYGQKVRYDSPESPVTEYGKAKLRAGKESRKLCNELGLRHCWCRVLSTYGEGDAGHTMVMSSIIKFLNNEDVDFTPGMQDWDYIYNGDVANALHLIGYNGKNNAVYPIGSGKTHKLKEYIETIRNCTNKNAKCNFGKIPYYENQVMYLCADIDNLKKDTGFEITTDFKTGVENTVKWYKERNNVGD